MQSFNIIKYKYEHGVYDINYMLKLVDIKDIDQKDFKEITGMSYIGLKSSKEQFGF